MKLVKDKVRHKMAGSSWEKSITQIGAPIRDQVRNQIKPQVSAQIWNYICSQIREDFQGETN